MVSYRFVPISSQKGVLFFETPGMIYEKLILVYIFDTVWSAHVALDLSNFKLKLTTSTIDFNFVDWYGKF